MRAAYVEDDIDARNIYARKLGQEGIQCDVFTTAEEALKAIQPGTYDILILDILLPGISGIKLLEQLRKMGIQAPCIIITAFGSLEHVREALNANANYLIEKPFSYQSLKMAINKVTDSNASIQHYVDRGLARLNLTPRENEIARLLLKGLSNAEIAKYADLSEKTAKQHITQIFEKAEVFSRAEFFSYIFPV